MWHIIFTNFFSGSTEPEVTRLQQGWKTVRKTKSSFRSVNTITFSWKQNNKKVNFAKFSRTRSNGRCEGQFLTYGLTIL